MLTPEVFAAGIATLATRWPQVKAPELQGVYGQYLWDLEDDEFRAGVKLAVAESEFLPSPKTIRAMARPEVSAKVEAGAVFTALLADGTVKSYDPRTGTSYSLTKIAEKYGDAAARAVVAIGGTRALSAVTEANEPFVRKEFREAFEGYAHELALRVSGQRLGAPSERPRLGAGDRVGRLEHAGAILDRMLPPGDR